MELILYSKPGCHLCEGLQEKLTQIRALPIKLEVRDITTSDRWFAAYEYEVPVLCTYVAGKEKQLPRPSPRATVRHLEQMLQKYVQNNDSE